MKAELKPCPFCGSSAVQEYNSARRHGYYIRVVCSMCGCQTKSTFINGYYEDEKTDEIWQHDNWTIPITRWNTRVNADD